MNKRTSDDCDDIKESHIDERREREDESQTRYYDCHCEHPGIQVSDNHVDSKSFKCQEYQTRKD